MVGHNNSLLASLVWIALPLCQ